MYLNSKKINKYIEGLIQILDVDYYRFPNSGAYLECLRSLKLRTTLTGLPFFQSSAVAPFISSSFALQLSARALKFIFWQLYTMKIKN